jgi:hypothetical protein
MLKIRSNKIEKSSQVRGMMDVNGVKEYMQREKIGLFKYVRIGNDYRFSDATDRYGLDHKMLSGGQLASSAGILHIYPNGLYVDGHSMTLNMGPAADDEDNLSKLFGLPIKSRW